jgi:integrase
MQDRNNPIPDTIEHVPSYPDTLVIYKAPFSRHWQMRAYVKKLVKRSTKTEDRAKAIVAAKAFYKELLIKDSTGQPLTTPTSNFKAVADALLEEDQKRVDRGERSQSLVDDGKYILKKDLLPFFMNDNVKGIDYARIQKYVDEVRKRSISSQPLKNHFIYLRKVLKHAHKIGLIDKIPIFPTIRTQDNPRDWFNEKQYETLEKAIRKAIKDKATVRYTPITAELADLTCFMMNTFLRPQDIKLLQNKHITIVKRHDRQYLRIMAKGKTAPAQVISTQAAVAIYERIKGDPDEYVFFKGMKSRDYAMSTMAKQFKYVLEKAGLKKSDNGQDRTLYSLRHTCIMNQLLNGKWPLITLARNCRTSPEMINRFYGSHLEAEMNVAQLHQRLEREDTLEDLFETLDAT